MIFFFSACTRREVIWRNYSSLQDFSEVKLLFVDNKHSDIKEFNLLPKRTQYIYIPRNYRYVGHEYLSEMSVCLYAYEPTIAGKRDKIEIFIFDVRKFDEDDEKFTVTKKDNVIAYVMRYFNLILNKNCTIFSRDNILYKEKVIYGHNESLYEILDKIEEKDYMDYTDYSINYGFENKHNGYIVQSRIDNRYIWLWTNQF